MYERFYHLRERPFALSPDPDYLYPSRVHREALSYLQYGIEGQAGFIVITGEIGCGKTTLLQTALRGLDRQTSVSRIVNTMLDGRELIEAVMLDFGIDPGDHRSKPHLLHELARFLVQQRMAGRLALLVIDEAQNLSLPALEEVRMLSNLETEKSKLIQIVLVGQPNLRTILARTELEQLRQRITVTYHLEPLDAPETAAYVNHRLRHAAIGAPLEFTRDVTDQIHLHAEGIPRKINVIADAILLFGYGEERHVIDIGLTNEVIEELESTGVIAPPSADKTPVAAITRQATVAPPTQQSARDAELARREAQLTVRERQLAEQQRVMLEEYRLLRTRREPGRPAAASSSWLGSQPSQPAPEPQITSAAPAPTPSVTPPAPQPASVAPAATVGPPKGGHYDREGPAKAGHYDPQPIKRGPYERSIVERPAPRVRRAAYRPPPPQPSLWARMRRVLLGVPKPVFED